jgi:Phosphoenolpyruvate phosphomutase
MRATTKLRHLIAHDGLVVAPGVFDGLSARLAQAEGFEVLYVTGGGIARGSGLPDLGLLTMTEMVDRMAQIGDVVGLPLIADADTGYGNALNVQRTVRAFQRAGVAGLHLEDQTFPKRCGHYADRRVVRGSPKTVAPRGCGCAHACARAFATGRRAMPAMATPALSRTGLTIMSTTSSSSGASSAATAASFQARSCSRGGVAALG